MWLDRSLAGCFKRLPTLYLIELHRDQGLQEFTLNCKGLNTDVIEAVLLKKTRALKFSNYLLNCRGNR